LSEAEISRRVGAVVVDYHAGEALEHCLNSLVDCGIGDIVVIDNGHADGLEPAALAPESSARLITPARNGGYGAGANLGARSGTSELLLICNPDLIVGSQAVERLVQVLDEHPEIAVVGPMLVEPDGSVYPSGRQFPNLVDSLGHAFVGLFWHNNPWTRRYRLVGEDQQRGRDADWVSGAAFLVRRVAFESVGGFDEEYFMYVEDVDLCWRLRRAGWSVAYEPSARVVHEQGHSTSRHPYRMLAAHHRSILRFANRSTQGAKRFTLPFVTVAIYARLVLACLNRMAGGMRGSASQDGSIGFFGAKSGVR